MSSKPSEKISYATLYEEWLLKNSEAKERLKNGEIDETQAREFLSAAIAARTGLAGSLQCALMEKSHDVEALTELWNQTIWESDEDAAAQVRSLLPLIQASNDYKIQNEADAKDDDESANVDSFFEDYPECVRQDWEESDSDESDDEEVQEVQHQSKKVATSAAPAFDRPQPQSSPQHLDMEVVVEKVQPSQAESHFSYTEPAPTMAAPQNPYMQQNSHQVVTSNASQAPPMPMQQQQQRQTAGARYNTWEQSNNNNTASWDDFRSQQNPFQTARELAQIGGDSEPQQQQGNNYQSMNHQQQQHNPYARPPQQEPQQVRAANIPDSLKRKFQPPKRGEPQQQRQNQGVSTKKKGAVLSNGGATVARTTSSKSEEDEELPEALKGLDKELIEKIQNEIMEAGESVSFDDIAGLDDAKQTVRELVCWPMKRPDLFTGLRRGPNGLLLFGPPGKLLY